MRTLSFFALLLGLTLAPAQCPTCPRTVAAPVTPAAYEWRPVDSAPGQFALYHNGQWIGSYDRQGDFYRPRTLDGKWLDPSTPPDPVPASLKGLPNTAGATVGNGITNYGLDLSRLLAGKDRYQVNGKEVSRKEAYEAFGGNDGTLPDDSGKPRLTFIGQAAPKDDPAFQGIKDKVLVQEYQDPNAPMIAGLGFTSPAVYLQDASGKVLLHTAQFDGPTVVETVRRLDPNYKPELDPTGLFQLPLLLQQVPAWGWVLGACVLFYLLSNRSPKE
jgi:hypothetical protein